MNRAQSQKQLLTLVRKKYRVQRLVRSLRYYARWVPEVAFLMERTAKELEQRIATFDREIRALAETRGAVQ